MDIQWQSIMNQIYEESSFVNWVPISLSQPSKNTIKNGLFLSWYYLKDPKF